MFRIESNCILICIAKKIKHRIFSNWCLTKKVKGSEMYNISLFNSTRLFYV